MDALTTAKPVNKPDSDHNAVHPPSLHLTCGTPLQVRPDEAVLEGEALREALLCPDPGLAQQDAGGEKGKTSTFAVSFLGPNPNRLQHRILNAVLFCLCPVCRCMSTPLCMRSSPMLGSTAPLRKLDDRGSCAGGLGQQVVAITYVV